MVPHPVSLPDDDAARLDRLANRVDWLEHSLAKLALQIVTWPAICILIAALFLPIYSAHPDLEEGIDPSSRGSLMSLFAEAAERKDGTVQVLDGLLVVLIVAVVILLLIQLVNSRRSRRIALLVVIGATLAGWFVLVLAVGADPGPNYFGLEYTNSIWIGVVPLGLAIAARTVRRARDTE